MLLFKSFSDKKIIENVYGKQYNLKSYTGISLFRIAEGTLIQIYVLNVAPFFDKELH